MKRGLKVIKPVAKSLLVYKGLDEKRIERIYYELYPLLFTPINSMKRGLKGTSCSPSCPRQFHQLDEKRIESFIDVVPSHFQNVFSMKRGLKETTYASPWWCACWLLDEKRIESLNNLLKTCLFKSFLDEKRIERSKIESHIHHHNENSMKRGLKDLQLAWHGIL